MKKLSIFFLFALLTFSFLMSKPAYSTHLAGMDLTYTCLGGNSYEITLAFYRDCSGVNVVQSESIKFECSSNPLFDFTANAPLIPNTGQEVTMGCNAMLTTCSGGYLYGIQEYIYKTTVTLPPCNSWTISYQMCCRNPSNTIANPTSQTAYIEAILDNSTAPCNNSPRFTNLPITIACLNQTWCYNHGALDPDGDSLSYSLIDPQITDGVPVQHVMNTTATQPLPSNPPITIDPVTGDICMTPNTLVVAPLAVLVEEWRTINGVPTKIGQIIRDMQINVVTCTNIIPIIGGMDFTQTHGYNPIDTIYYHEVCLGPSVAFNIWGYDADSTDPSNIGNPEIFDITWNSGIPNGTFTVYNSLTDSAYANFTWTPTSADVSNTPKCFTATIRDEACPYNGNQTFSYCIVVRGMSVDIGDDTLLCAGEAFTIHALADTTTVNYNWYIDGSPTGLPLSDTLLNFNSANYSTGMHFVAIETDDGSTTTQCPGKDTVWVNLVSQPTVDLGKDTSFCDGNSITLNAGPGAIYLWNTGVTTQNLIVDSTGLYYVYVDGNSTSYSRCNSTDSIYVSVAPIPNVDLAADTCLETAPYALFAGNDPNIFNYSWTDASNNVIGNSENIMVSTSGTYNVVVSAKMNANCYDEDFQKVNIINGDIIEAERDGTNLGSGPQSMCTHHNMILKGPQPPSGHNYAFQWTDNGQPFGNNETIVLDDLSEGVHTIAIYIDGGCSGTMEILVEYCELTIPNVVTPDGNGLNDVFEIEGLEFYPNSEMLIYDRWGNRVFHSNNYQVGSEWNPIENSDGVYYYVFKVADKRKTERSGTVTVIRK